ncbi:hypothetical protein B0T25DRAFT_481219 [Lasiosphaeria hispida]|uniref:Uncharacterized protein n=1 Tax=Lasiosphaeria hispida TaxID=260671 RepID=A0AAJ0HDJ8_9PEZI|nr:hypothetical protein B0T25DRAFT_481219 [Lasiosphaeria hispida]
MAMLPSAKPSPRSPLRFLGLFILVVFVSCTSLLVLWTFGPQSRRVGWGPLSPTTTILALSSSQALAIDQRKTTIFKSHPEFENLSYEFDHFWDETLPPNLGFLRLFDHAENRDAWVGVSMFHQLHCLGMIRTALQSVVEEVEDLRAAVGGIQKGNLKRENDHQDHHSRIHFLHCFDYLRQSLTCLADDTIEMPVAGLGGRFAIDGSGPRQCRSASKLWELALESGLRE